jgi:hypothetical protein
MRAAYSPSELSHGDAARQKRIGWAGRLRLEALPGNRCAAEGWPYSADEMTATPVWLGLNNPRFDGPACVEPIKP